MKKLLMLIAAAVMCCCAWAQQEIVVGDMDDSGDLTIGDVTELTNTILGKQAVKKITTCDPDASKPEAVAGSWRSVNADILTLNADGSASHTTNKDVVKFEYYPFSRDLLLLNNGGYLVEAFDLLRKSADYIVLNAKGSADYLGYYPSANFVSGISFAESSVEVNSGKTIQLTPTITPSSAIVPSLSWTSSNEAVATVDQNGLVTGVKGGTATITATANDGSGVVGTCTVIVKAPDTKEYVDLGLPTGTLWATCNIGSQSPEEYGDYFAWGETEPQADNRYSWASYSLCKGSSSTMTKYCQQSKYGYNGFTDTLTELESADDAATVNWGADWQMPSLTQIDELINSSNTTTTWTTVNGVYGRKITSKKSGYTDKYIFLPAAGYRYDGSLFNAGSNGYYWSRSLDSSDSFSAYYLYFSSRLIISYNLIRYSGQSVRPVRVSKN